MRTDDGYGAEEHEIHAVLAALVGAREGEDPSSWFAHLSSRRSLLLAAAHRIADMTAQAAEEIYQDMGDERSYRRLADTLGLSRSRAQQLIERAARVTGPS